MLNCHLGSRVWRESVVSLVAVAALAAGFVPTSATAQVPSGTLIQTCNDGGEWPPYFYYDRVNGEKTDDILGFDIDVFNEIFTSRGYEYTFELIAWSRCLLEVEKGEDYFMVSSVAYSKERDEKYLITEPYYTVQPHYFYHYANFPNGLEISSLADFSNYNVCGLRGYNYTNFGIPVEDIDTGTRIFSQLIEKTRRNRCDIFLGRFEIFSGFARTGNDYIRDNNLGTAPMPGVAGDKFYMMVSRNYQYAEELREMINDGINRLKSTGLDQTMIAPYLQ
ncbi:MAG: transporter substrate-binding domain-containing protein [Pseudomonadota bacterium]